MLSLPLIYFEDLKLKLLSSVIKKIKNYILSVDLKKKKNQIVFECSLVSKKNIQLSVLTYFTHGF